jgi:signal transduction histidine kinase
MDRRIEDVLIYSIFGIMGISLVVLVFNNIENPWMIMLLSALFLFLFTVKYISSRSRVSTAGIFIACLEILLVYYIGLKDCGEIHTIFYYCIGVYFVLLGSKGSGVTAFLFGYTARVVGLFTERIGQPLWATTLEAIYSLLLFAAMLLIAFVIEYIISKNTELDKVSKQLKLKTLEQEETYKKLLVANGALEEMTAIKERNRIAREIHDTIGHKLTTAVIEIEAGKTIFPKEKEKALEKFSLAQQQVRSCLDEVRRSVRSLENYTAESFLNALSQLIEETEIHTGVKIKYQMEPMDYPVAQKSLNIIYRIVQEGITNGIKHGGSTVFVLTIKKVDGNVIVILQDNGRGCGCVVKGFGLKSMEARLEEVKGQLILESEEDEGFVVKATVPLIG